jgi:hypothetical protein
MFPRLCVCFGYVENMLREKKEAELRAILGEDYEPPTTASGGGGGGACGGACGAVSDTQCTPGATAAAAPPRGHYVTSPPRKSVSDPKSAATVNDSDKDTAVKHKEQQSHTRRQTYVVSPAGFKTHPNTPNVDTGASDISGRVASGEGAVKNKTLVASKGAVPKTVPKMSSPRTMALPKPSTSKSTGHTVAKYGGLSKGKWGECAR